MPNIGTFDEPSDAPPAKGSTTAVAHMNVAISSTLPSGLSTGKAASKKAGGSSTAHTGTAPVVGKIDRGGVAKGGMKHSVSASDVVSSRQHQGGGLLPGPILSHSQPLSSQPVRLPVSVPSSNTVGVVTGVKSPASSVAVTTGAVRRLFASQQQQPQAVPGSQSSTVFSILGPQPSYPPLVSPSPSAPSVSHSQITSAKPSSSQAVKHAPSSAHIVKSLSTVGARPTNQNAGYRSAKGSESTSHASQNVPQSGGKEKHAATPISKMASQPSMYSSVISTGAPPTPTSLDPPPSTPNSAQEVIEQPLQQIMKTPMLFHESATQLTKPRKKSTYSDAVGKKSDSSTSMVNSGGAATPKGSLGGIVSHTPPQPPVSVAPVGPPTPQTQHKLNLAPGTRPVGGANSTEKVKNMDVSIYG